MPSLQIYMFGEDCEFVRSLLNDDLEIAFIVPTAAEHWVAVDTLQDIPVDGYTLWHIPSGPFPALSASKQLLLINDPWVEWTGESVFRNLYKPMIYAGGQPGVITFEANNSTDITTDRLHVSYFGWVGNKGNLDRGWPISEATALWWQNLRKKIKSASSFVPAGGLHSGNRREVYALPNAMDALQRGIAADISTLPQLHPVPHLYTLG